MNSIKSQKGQALVETVLLLPVIAIMVVMIAWFGRLMITRQQLIMAARYGTDLIVYTNMDENQIKNQIKDFLCGDVLGRKLNTEKFGDRNIKIVINRFDKIEVEKNNVISVTLSMTNLIDDITDTTTSTVDIYYDFNTPTIFSAFSYISAGTIPNSVRISARSEVLAGTGA